MVTREAIREKASQARQKLKETTDKEKTTFLSFLTKSAILPLALGMIIGASTKDVVNSLVEGILSPLLSILLSKILPESNLEDWIIEVEGTNILIGEFINTLLEMFLILIILYIVIGALFRKKEWLSIVEEKEKPEKPK